MNIKFILIFFILFNSVRVFAWDSTTAKYLPLQVGNTWVYSSYYASPVGYGSGYERYKLTGTQFINGKMYYVINYTHLQISGNFTCSSKLFLGNLPIRIDTVSLNIYRSISCNSFDEALVDSLSSRFGDTANTCFSYHGPKTALNDTADFFIFDSFRKAKKFSTAEFEGGNDQTYVSGIGMVRYYFSQLQESCSQLLKGCIINGAVYGDTSMLTGINSISSEVPDQFSLMQNYPNPFNPTTQFGFRIADFGLVRLTVFDALGGEVTSLVNQQLNPGTYEVSWDASVYPSGVYYYRLESGTFTQTRKMVLIK